MDVLRRYTMMTNITALQPGEHFMFKNFEWVCLDPSHPDGGVLAIMAKPWAKEMKFCPDKSYADEKGNWNNYRTSLIRKKLNGTLVDELGADNLIPHKIDLVADNGDGSYGTVEDLVFILTSDEYRKYRDFLLHYFDWIWTASPGQCGNEHTDIGYTRYVRYVYTGAELVDGYGFSNYAVVPACILKPASLNPRQSMACVEEASK